MSGEPVYESSEDKDEASQLTALREKKSAIIKLNLVQVVLI